MAPDRSGSTAIEYAVIASLISIAIVGSLHAIGADVLGFFNRVVDGFPQ